MPWRPRRVGCTGPCQDPLGLDSCATFTPTLPSRHSLRVVPAAVTMWRELLVVCAALLGLSASPAVSHSVFSAARGDKRRLRACQGHTGSRERSRGPTSRNGAHLLLCTFRPREKVRTPEPGGGPFPQAAPPLSLPAPS